VLASALALWILAADPVTAPPPAAPPPAPAQEAPPEVAPAPAPVPAVVDAAPAPAAASTAAASTGAHPTRFRGALESLVMSFPSGAPDEAGDPGKQDVFVTALPLLGFDGGDDFGFELGAELRLRLFDDPPAQKDRDYGRLIRREDWDETSDFGQILRELRIGPEEGVFSVRAGPMLNQSLGHGHLVSRYSNRDNPNYHPSGVFTHLVLGPTRTEFLASDFLAARLFAAEISVDMGRILSSDAGQTDRYHLAFSFAHDNGATGFGTPPLTLLHTDFDAALYRGAEARVFAFIGMGSRIFVPEAFLGGNLGLSVEGTPAGTAIGGKAELRKQYGGFRQGMFGAGYELSRYSAVGRNGVPLADDRLGDGFSGYAEFWVASGPEEGTASRISFSSAGEYFSFDGRVDADATIAVRLMGGRLLTNGRLVVTGVGLQPRYLATGEARFRFASAFYAMVSAGTVFFPQPDRSLLRGVYAGAGVGVDFER
jgi:hypothetical protein